MVTKEAISCMIPLSHYYIVQNGEYPGQDNTVNVGKIILDKNLNQASEFTRDHYAPGIHNKFGNLSSLPLSFLGAK